MNAPQLQSQSPLRDILPLLLAGVIGRIPYVSLPIASLLLVADRTNLARGGLASGAVSLGAGLIGVLVGRHLDDGKAKVVLIGLAVAHIPAVIAFVRFAGTSSAPLLVLVAFAAGVTLPPIGTVVRAQLAQRTDRTQARQAFAYEAMSVEATWIGGPLLVSAAIWLGGSSLAVFLSPVLVVLGVAVVLREPVRRQAVASGAQRWLTGPVVRLLVAFGLTGTAFRAMTIAVAEVARRVGQPEASGVLLAVWALGSLLGGWYAARRPVPSTAVLGMAVAFSLALVGVASGSLWLTGVLVLLTGLPTAAFISGINTLVSVAADESAHARAFAAMQAGATIMSALGAAVGGAVIERYGPAVVAIPAGVLLAAAAGLTCVKNRTGRPLSHVGVHS